MYMYDIVAETNKNFQYKNHTEFNHSSTKSSSKLHFYSNDKYKNSPFYGTNKKTK